MQIVDLMDRMISYYRMCTRTKKWTMRMVMHFTDLALANSWLLYRKDHAICAGPKTRPIQFLQFRMEVATILLAQHHGGDADLSTQSEEEEDSNQGVKRHVTEFCKQAWSFSAQLSQPFLHYQCKMSHELLFFLFFTMMFKTH